MSAGIACQHHQHAMHGLTTAVRQILTAPNGVQVKTTWDENLYTTKLDKSKAGISVAEAERIAAEIERQTTRNRHMAEERNIKDLSVQEVGALEGHPMSIVTLLRTPFA